DLVAAHGERQLMEGDDGAVEKELARSVRDDRRTRRRCGRNHASPRLESLVAALRKRECPGKALETQCGIGTVEPMSPLCGPASRLGGALEIALVDEAPDIGGGLALWTILPAQVEHALDAGKVELAAGIEALRVCDHHRVVLLGAGGTRFRHLGAQDIEGSLLVGGRLQPGEA